MLFYNLSFKKQGQKLSTRKNMTFSSSMTFEVKLYIQKKLISDLKQIKSLRKKLLFKQKSDLMWPSMTFKDTYIIDQENRI